MNVGQLRAAIANLPDNMPVMADDSESAWDNAELFIAPANRSSAYGFIGEGHLNPKSDWGRVFYGDYQNIHVLLITSWGQPDDYQDITPK